jgi:hypothetical protein
MKNVMDFHHAVKTINKLLREKRPDAFNSSWIQNHAPHVYRFIQKNIRADAGGIDWDRITRSIDRRFQRKWNPSYRKSKILYREKEEVRIIFQKYHSKLYVFISPQDRSDEYIRDSISIALVRIAQKGNVLAQEEITNLVRLTIDDWIESRPILSSWEGHESLIPRRVETCISRYRYSGTFIGNLIKTLEYAGRGLISTYSMDDSK